MGLWRKVKRWLPLSLLAATAIYVLSDKPSPDLESRVDRTEEQEREQRRSERRRKWLLSGTAASLGALGLAHIYLRAKGKKKSFLQPAVENPGLSGLVTALGYGAAAYSTRPNVYSAMAGSVVGLMVYASTAVLHLVKPPYFVRYPRYLWNVIRGTYGQIRGDIPLLQDSLERMRQDITNPARIDIDLVDVLLKQHRIDEALDVLTRAMPKIDDAAAASAFERVFSQPLAQKVADKGDAFSTMLAHLRQGDVREALEVVDKFAEKDPGPVSYAVRAYITQSIADALPSLKQSVLKQDMPALETQAEAAWVRAITKILEDPAREQKFRRIGESRNEVLECDAGPFLRNLILLKRCDVSVGQRLRDERETMQVGRVLHGKQVARTLVYVEHDGKSYHVVPRKKSRTLHEIVKEGNIEERRVALRHASDFLLRYHFSAFPFQPVSQGHYAERLHSVFLDQLPKSWLECDEQKLRAELEIAGMHVRYNVQGAVRGWKKDATHKNWLPDKPEEDFAIDYEHRSKVPVQEDVVRLAEFHSSTPSERLMVRKNYLRGLEKRFPHERAQFLRQYRWAAMQQNLELVGYRARDKELEEAAYHLESGKAHARRVGENRLAELLEGIRVPTAAGPSAGH